MISAGQRNAITFDPSSFSAIARSVMISATAFVSTIEDPEGFSAIARSVMISAGFNSYLCSGCRSVSVL